jgi:predicted ATPase
MMQELVAQRGFRIVCATHSPVLIEDPATCVINLDNHVNRNVPLESFGVEGASTIQ